MGGWINHNDNVDLDEGGNKERRTLLPFFIHSTHTTKPPPPHSTTNILTHGPLFFFIFNPSHRKNSVFYQYHRILKRRAARANLEAESRLLQRGRKVRGNAQKRKGRRKSRNDNAPTLHVFVLFFSFFKHILGRRWREKDLWG